MRHCFDGNVPAVQRQVVVSGVGVVSAFGASAAAFRDALLDGRRGVARVTAFDTAECRTTLAAPVAGFAASTWIPPMKLRRMDPTGVFAVVVSGEAMRDAGYAARPDGDDNAGVVFGTCTAGGQATSEYLQALFRGGPLAAPALLFNSTVGNAAASLAGLEFKLRGPNVTISHKEASGLAAIVTATDFLRQGRAVMLAAGGIDAISEPYYKAHDRFRAMTGDRDPAEVRGPFDRARHGFVMGEGGFALWLEDGARGARSYGEILGVGAAGAAVSINMWPDRTEPLVRTMRLALDDAGLVPGEVDVIYASANGTAMLDGVEAAAIAELFADASPVVTSIKGAIGEFGAAGAASALAALLCGQAGQVPPIAGLVDPDDTCSPLRLAMTVTPAPGPHVLVNSFASGGALFSLVLRVA
jgi:3-oxoacyl-[acyl-carrier-protein] synthase II